MTKPTQAQIEAARLAIAAQQKCSLPCACGRNPQPHLNDCMTIAKAALTAAAEVGAVDQPLLDAITLQEMYRKECENIEAAAIERCAQVVSELRRLTWDATSKQALSEAVAAIRALKDKKL